MIEHYRSRPRPLPVLGRLPDEDDSRRAGEGPGENDASSVSGQHGGSDLDALGPAGIPPDLLSILGPSDAAALLLDSVGLFIYANEAAISLLEYASVDEIVGLHFTQICDHDLVWLQTQFQRLAANQIWSGRVVLRSRRDNSVPVAVNAATLVLGPGGATIYAAFIRPTRVSALPIAAELESLPHGLTAAEIRLLQLYIENFREGDLAVILGKDALTVSASIDSILRKTGTSSLVKACMLALKEHLLT